MDCKSCEKLKKKKVKCEPYETDGQDWPEDIQLNQVWHCPECSGLFIEVEPRKPESK